MNKWETMLADFWREARNTPSEDSPLMDECWHEACENAREDCHLTGVNRTNDEISADAMKRFLKKKVPHDCHIILKKVPHDCRL